MNCNPVGGTRRHPFSPKLLSSGFITATEIKLGYIQVQPKTKEISKCLYRTKEKKSIHVFPLGLDFEEVVTKKKKKRKSMDCLTVLTTRF